MLIKCPECNHEISDKAASCPKCGFDLIKNQKIQDKKSYFIVHIIAIIIFLIQATISEYFHLKLNIFMMFFTSLFGSAIIFFIFDIYKTKKDKDANKSK